MRSRWVLVSIVSHSLAIAAAAIAPLVATVELPAIQSPLPEYVSVFAKDINLPAPPHVRGRPPVPVLQNVPPLVAPEGITTEPVGQLLQPDVPGVEGGVEQLGSVIEGGAIGTVVAPPLAPAEPSTVRVSKGVEEPRKLVDVAPVYPTIAINARKEGIVILEAVIDPRGFVTDVRVLRSIPLLDQAAIDAVRQWRYTPTRLNGTPVSVVMTVTVKFALK